MDFAVSLAEWSIVTFAVVLLVGQLVAHEVGYRIGVFSRERAPGQTENVGVVVAGMLGLLAFVLALTLSFSTARFTERRQGTLLEANAIGTAWLRATAMNTPETKQIAILLKDYAQTRESFIKSGRNKDDIAKVNQHTSDLQQSIWVLVSHVVQERPDPISSALMASVNDTFDASTAERFALGIRLPWQIFWLLAGVMLVRMGALGYQFGLKGRPVRVMILCLTIVWTALVVNILDLASPRVGNFRTDASVYDWTIQGFRGAGGT
jgi:hypothetical protein